MTLPGALAALLTRLASAAEPVLWDEPAPVLELTDAERALFDPAQLRRGGALLRESAHLLA